MKKITLIILLLYALVGSSIAQQRNITGLVTDTTLGEPIPGVTVLVRGTTRGTVTDINGRYSIEATNEEYLIFSFIGFTELVQQVGNRTSVNISLKEKISDLEAVVVTGYQVQKRSDLTGSISIVNIDETRDIPSGSTLQNLQGRVPGLYIQASGTPSGAASSVNIRGVNTLGNTSPLYVIDGVPTTDPNIFQFMDQNSIESVQVLKDASASSIYGSRASNGVIIVTTKQGANTISVTVNSSVTLANNTRRLSMLNTEQFGRVLWQGSINGGTPTSAHRALYSFNESLDGNGRPILNSVTPVPFINGDSNIPSADTDWQNETFQTGVITQNNVLITGGTKNTSSLISIGHFSNSGIIVNNKYERITARINNSVSIFNGIVKVGQNLQILHSKENPMGGDQFGLAGWNDNGTQRTLPVGGSPQTLSTTILPILPVRKLDGSFAGPIGTGFSDRMNPVFLADLDRDDVNRDVQTFGNVFLEVLPFENFVFRSNFGLDYTNNFDQNFERRYTHGFLSRNINNMSVAQRHRTSWTWSNTASYLLELNKSRISFLGGIEAIRNFTQVIQTLKQGFAVEDLPYFQLGAGTGIATNNGFATENKLLSYFGNVNYAYADKYLASATIRYDGSSRFGENNSFGFFPSLSLGWVLSKERFIADNLPIISFLKLRSGVGRVGNQEIGDYVRFQQFLTNYGTVGPGVRASGSAYDIGGVNTGALPSGFVAVRAANPNLRWETTEEINTGIDFGFLNQKIYGSFDYFSRTTKDILVTPPTPATIGEGAIQTVNGATMANRGFELALGFADSKGNFNYSIDGNITRFSDEVTFLPPSVVRSYGGNVEKTILGQSSTAFFGFVADGLFQNAEEVAQHATQPGKGVGRIRYKDLNNDGIINALDQDWLGNALPSFIYGLNTQVGYKNWSLSVFMRGVVGVTVQDGSKATTDLLGTNVGVNKGTRLLEAWTPENNTSNIPAVSLFNANSETRASTYFLVNGSYFKIQTIQLSYTVPQTILQNLGLTALRFYGVADNSFLLFNQRGPYTFTGPDPETPGSIYPRPIRFTFGVEVKF
jgi:TonB-linked SusC/RagA family outer membrane protein